MYSLSFDPLGGSAVPPRYLLSSSADATTRLWSLDTMTNVVAYRGHQQPVWDVQWSPMGIYFATASRDRTARLWSTDRTSCLRIYVGHLSDVDVGRLVVLSVPLTYPLSVFASIPTRYILQPDRAIGRLVCGTSNAVRVCGYSSGTKELSLHWRLVRMVGISLAQAKTSLSISGTWGPASE